MKYAAGCTVALLALCLLPGSGNAAEFQIKIPKHTKPTPVQQLNQEGVKALAHNDVTRAKRAFYHAYLIDPDDPFTLNNLGYMAELDGDIDRAQKFYDLSAANTSDAAIAFASDPDLQGKQVSQVTSNTASIPMRVNRFNVLALGLVMKDRAPEAELTLRRALQLDPKNPFTLNNLGYALEKEGELEQALNYYSAAASIGSNAQVVIALNRSWRGHTISEIAALNTQAARRELSGEGSTEAKVARLNLRGVSALNRGQNAEALQLFQQAYRLDPNNAFSLNNMGYIAETAGDRETANFYYEKARQAPRNSDRVALASRKDLEGLRLSAVAGDNQQVVEVAQEKQLAALRAQGAPPLPLRTRDLAVVREPTKPPTQEPETPVRILSEYNAPPAPQAPAAPQQQAQRPLPSAIAAPQQQPVRPSQPEEDNTPLLPVIPDE